MDLLYTVCNIKYVVSRRSLLLVHAAKRAVLIEQRPKLQGQLLVCLTQARNLHHFSAPMRDLGRKAQTVPTMDVTAEMNMTVVAKTLSLAVISLAKSLR